MSSLIIQNHAFFFLANPPLPDESAAAPQRSTPPLLADTLQSRLGKLINLAVGELISCREDAERLEVVVVHRGIIPPNALLQILAFSKSSKQWTNSLQLLDCSGAALKVGNSEKRRFLWNSLLLRGELPFKISVNCFTGTIRLSLLEVAPSLTPESSRLYALADELLRTVKLTFGLFKHNYGYQIILEEFYRHCERHVAGSRAKTFPAGVRKCMKQFGVQFWVGEEGEAQGRAIISEEIEKQSRQRIIQKQAVLSSQEQQALSLYTSSSEQYSRPLYENELELSILQREQLRWKLQLPSSPSSPPLPNDNDYILNCIKFNDYSHLQLMYWSQSNFSTIYRTRREANFWYVYSGNNNEVVASEETFTRDKLIRKPIIVKREKGNRRNRVEHEKNILKQIKGGRAVFIPQYYLSTVENELKEDLLSDFLWRELTLDKLAIFRRSSLSLGTKCFILLMVLQGVRYISMFGIVHLDLKPGNLMVSNSLNVKIIDFGESYHPAICNSITPAYAPGFSPPYGSPEAFCPPPDTKYTEKSDVFSIGVIAHEFLFGKVPFSFDYGKQMRIFGQKQYVEHMFYTPEELATFGDEQIFPALQLAIGRCLDPNPERRPSLDWLCLFLRECTLHYRS